MKKTIIISVLFLFASPSIFGQQTIVEENVDTWGDYHFINGDYQKAIRFFESATKELRLEQQRNFAQAYLLNDQKDKAKSKYSPVAESKEASVQDYYRYANLLIEEERLANEYRTKAYQLPWATPSLFANDSLLFKARFGSSIYSINGVEGNTENNEFGLVFFDDKATAKVFYLSDQQKSRGEKKSLKRIKSDLPIYNFYQASFTSSPSTLFSSVALPTSINTFFQEGPGSYHPATDLFYFTRSDKKNDKKKTVQLNVYVIKSADINQNKIALQLPFNKEGFATVHPSKSRSLRHKRSRVSSKFNGCT